MLASLPPDILCEIFSRVDSERTLSNIAMVCREWSELALEETVLVTVRQSFPEKHKKFCSKCREEGWVPLEGWSMTKSEPVSLDCLLYAETVDALCVDQIYLVYTSVDSVLRIAIEKNEMGIIRFILKKEPSVFHRPVDFMNKTAVHVAVQAGGEGMLRFLIEDVGLADLCEKKDDSGATPVDDAVTYNNVDAMRFFVEARDLPIQPKARRYFHLAVSREHHDMVRFLSKHLSPLNVRRKEDGDTVLHGVAALGLDDVLRYFVEEYGLENFLSERNAAGETVLSIALARGSLGAMRYLVGLLGEGVQNELGTACCTLSKAGEISLYQMMLQCDHAAEVLRYLVQEEGLAGFLCTITDSKGRTPLHVAVESQRLGVVELLAAHFSGPELCKGKCLVHLALRQSQHARDMVMLLSKHLQPADFRCREVGKSVLHAAARRGDAGLLRYMVEQKGLADLLPEPDDGGTTVLTIALANGSVDLLRCVMDLLGDRGEEEFFAACFAEPASPDEVYLSSLFLGLATMDILRYLVEERGLADQLCSVKDPKGRTLLHAAVQNDCPDAVEYLFEHAKQSAWCKGRCLLYTVFQVPFGDVSMIQLLLKHLKPVDLRCQERGETILHAAARMYRPELNLVRCLVEEHGLGDLLLESNEAGETVMSIVVAQGHLSLLRFLVDEHGAGGLEEACCAKDADGRPAIMLCSANYMSDVDALLQYVCTEKGLSRVLFERDRSGATVFHNMFTATRPHVVLGLSDKSVLRDLCRITNEEGKSVLHTYAYDLDVLRFVVGDLGLVDLCEKEGNDGCTPLHCIAQLVYGRLDALRYLVEEKGYSHLCRQNGVLHLAIGGFDDSVVRLLVDRMTPQDLRRKFKGETVLHVAARQSKFDLILFFIQEKGLGDLVCEKNSVGETVVLLLLLDGRVDVLDNHACQVRLSDLEAACRARDEKGNPLFHRVLSTTFDHLAIVGVMRYLVLKKGLRGVCDEKDAEGNSVLHAAAYHHTLSDSLPLFSFLAQTLGLQHLCFEANDAGETLLHVAARVGFSKAWYLEVGSSLHLPDDMYTRLKACVDASGRTAADVAESKERTGGGDPFEFKFEFTSDVDLNIFAKD